MLGTDLEYIILNYKVYGESMLKSHLEFIFIIVVLAFGIHIKNKFFSAPKSNIALQMLNPMKSSLNPFEGNTISPKTQSEKSKTNIEPSFEKSLGKKIESQELVQIQLPKVQIKSELKKDRDSESSTNSFTKTYQKFANLEFSNNKNKQYLIDFKGFKQNFLSLGFTVDQGQIQSPKVIVSYTNGSSEEITIPYDQMFINDWVKLETQPNLNIKNILVSAATPNAKSVFSFFVQKHL
jgi:hypothetical protein